jgi:hypothetical protein
MEDEEHDWILDDEEEGDEQIICDGHSDDEQQHGQVQTNANRDLTHCHVTHGHQLRVRGFPPSCTLYIGV